MCLLALSIYTKDSGVISNSANLDRSLSWIGNTQGNKKAFFSLPLLK